MLQAPPTSLSMRDSNAMFIVGTPKKFKTFLVMGLIVWPPHTLDTPPNRRP